jgi:hypothetical protein
LSTAYLARDEQLLADFWHFRVLVREPHRRSNLAVALAVTSRRHLRDRFVTGRDTRGVGFIFAIENEGLNRHFPKGLWYESDVLFVGKNPRGAYVRVHYFPGVLAPEPAPAPQSALVRIPR